MHAHNDDPSLPEAAPFELRVLGQFELVRRQTGALVPVSAAKMRALIAYLTAAPRFTATRRRLAGHLWASSGEKQALHSLRELLSKFRRAGAEGSAIIASDETNVSLDGSMVAVDREALMAARADADVPELMRVTDVYRNDFVLGLKIGEIEFDDGWTPSGFDAVKRLSHCSTA